MFPLQHVTPARVAALAATVAVISAALPALLGFYVTTVAVAAMLGAAFAAYLAVVDEPAEWAIFELATCVVAALLIVAGTSLRFPAVVAGATPPVAIKLAWLALAVAGTAAVTSVVREHGEELWSLRGAGLGRVTRRT
ncbi:MAG: hypothetical protein ABJB93_10830 [Gaiellales bacterium]